MFKSILPSKKTSSTEFTMVSPLGETDVNGKENVFNTGRTKPSIASTKGFPQGADKRKRSNTKGKETFEDGAEMLREFDQLLDDMQIPQSTREKLYTMEPSVKAAMLKSHRVLGGPAKTSEEPTPPLTPRSLALRRTRSTESFTPSQIGMPLESELIPPQAPFMGGQVSSHHNSTFAAPSTPRKSSGHIRGLSFDSPGLKSRSQVNLPMSTSSLDLTAGGKGSGKDKGSAPPTKTMAPVKIISALSGTSSTQIDVETIKKLRLLLRNESAAWTQDFLRQGGYSALLTRLNELLEVEWREEQHDDQVLHELLRCIKALSTSSIGCFALRSSGPTPFVQLVSLLYSDKKPGEVGTRQLITEIILLLFDIYPASALPSSNQRTRREAWETEPTSRSNLITLPAPHKNFFSFMRSLLLTPAPPSAEAPEAPVSPHDFIESLHTPRIYKAYLQELCDVCRDYFWVFCHPNNTIWILPEVDETRVEKPRAPGGMTGGVEFEAMQYFTTHLRLVNAVAKSVADLGMPKGHELSAHAFHSDLFLSGLERIILISRKASTTYYPTLHLELSRYMAHASKAGYEIPWTVSRLMGPPPAALCRVAAAPAPLVGRSAPTTPTKRSAAPAGMLA